MVCVSGLVGLFHHDEKNLREGELIDTFLPSPRVWCSVAQAKYHVVRSVVHGRGGSAPLVGQETEQKKEPRDLQSTVHATKVSELPKTALPARDQSAAKP